MEDKKIKVKVTAHAFNAFMDRLGISDTDTALTNLRDALSYGNLEEGNRGAYLNFPFIGGQMPLTREDDHYVAKTFFRTFRTHKGKEVEIEYIF